MRSPRRVVLPALVMALSAAVVACGDPAFDIPSSELPTNPRQTGTAGGQSEADGRVEADEGQPAPSGQTDPTSLELAWSLPTRRMVSAPVAVGGKVVAYAAHRGRLSLIVVDPRTGTVVARRPSSSSYVTPGLTMSVATRGDLVYHYRPAGSLQLARVEVYDVRRDRVVGRSEPAYFWSLPTGCVRPDAGPVCVSAGEAEPAAVYRVSGRTGRLRLAAAGVGRSLGAGLYEASGMITRLGADGRRWQRTAPAMFGDQDVTPAEGWDWQQQGGLLIGSFGAEERRLDDAWIKRSGHIARIDPRSGRTLWVLQGTTYCELDIMEPAAQGPRRWFRCSTYGRAPATADGGYDLSAWKTSITRFDPRTGEPLWSIRPARWDTIYDGSTWVKLSDSLVAGRRGGSLVTLDVTSGQVTKADPEAIGWCAQRRTYHDRDSSVRPQTRIARGLASPCRADGQPVTRPAFVDPVFGVRIGATFVWASTTGLRAVRVG